MKSILAPEKGTWVLLCFVAFFALVVAVNVVFISTALSTHSGVVTDQPYEKGLAYNETLAAADAQPVVKHKPSWENGVLKWELFDESGRSIDANVTALLYRSVKDGSDFTVTMEPVADGVYEAAIDLPMEGRWEAQLKALWNSSQYQTRFVFVSN